MEENFLRIRENLAARIYEPQKIYFTHHAPNSSVSEIARLFTSRFHVQDISLHQGFGYVYVNDIDARRKINVYNGNIFHRGQQLFLSEGLTYKTPTTSISAHSSKNLVEKSVETEDTPDALVEDILKIDWNAMDILDLKRHGKSIQQVLFIIQTAYKKKLCMAENQLRVSQIPLPSGVPVEQDDKMVEIQSDEDFIQHREPHPYQFPDKYSEEIQKFPLQLEHKNAIRPASRVLRNISNTPGNVPSKSRRRVDKYDPINLRHVKLLKDRLEMLSPISGNGNSYPVCTSTPENMSLLKN